MKPLSKYKFANSKIERELIKFWIYASEEEIKQFNKTLKIIPISSFVDGIFRIR